MRRLLPTLTTVAATALVLAGCASTPAAQPEPVGPTPSVEAAVPVEEEPTEGVPADPVTIRIASLKGPTTMGLVGLMADAQAGDARHDYQVTMHGTPDEVVPLVVQGQVDVALVPANLGAVLHNRTLTDDGPQVQVAAISTLGVLSVLEAGDTVDEITDLAGRTVYASGKGASPEYVLDHLLRSNGLEPGTDVSVEYRSEHTEVAALLASTPGAVAMLPQPFATVVTTQNPGVRTALDLTEEWARVTPDSQLVTGVVVVRTAFAQENPEAVEDFLADYRASAQATNDDPATAAALIAEAGIVPAAPIAEAAIPGSHVTYVDGDELRRTLDGYLRVLFDADPASVGGSLPGDELYLSR